MNTIPNSSTLQTPVQLIHATLDQQPVLANLLELYAHDFSEFHNIEVEPDGRFGYSSLPLYWQEPGRLPFLLRVNSHWAGFALVKQGSEISGDPAVRDMAEFFVLRGYRGRGIGTEAAHHLWRLVPGRWEVRVMQSNLEAHDFWQRAIDQFTGKTIQSVRFEKAGKPWRLFSFDASAGS